MDTPVTLRLVVDGEHGSAVARLAIEVEQGRESEALEVVSRVVRESMFRLGFEHEPSNG